MWPCNQLYNGLVDMDDSLNIVPSIAKRWTISEDGLTYTFYLRDDVTFHNTKCYPFKTPRKVVAQDFVYSFSRILDPNVASPGAWIFQKALLRMLAGVDSVSSGEIIPGSGVKIGYFSQDNAETIKGSESILDYVESNAPTELIPKIRDMLGSFLFRGDDVFKPLNVLSGGEKSRIALLKLLLSPNNLLILDEPTNHLDMHSKDVLMNALKDFGGTVIFVSHDRGFIEGLATKVLELKNGCHREFPGDYKYYMERIAAEEEGLVSSPVENKAATVQAVEPEKSAGKISWEEQKKLEAEKRKAEKEVSRIEEEISKAEEEKSALEAKMALPEVYSNGAKAKEVQQKIDAIASKLDELNQAWETAMEKVL